MSLSDQPGEMMIMISVQRRITCQWWWATAISIYIY